MQKEIMAKPAWEVYDENNDQHVHAIDGLVRELGIPAEEVNRSYRELLDEMKNDTDVKVFLPILVSQGVRKRLQQ